MKPAPYQSAYIGKSKDGLRLTLYGEGGIPSGEGIKIIVMEGAIKLKDSKLTRMNTLASPVEAAILRGVRRVTLGHAGMTFDEDEVVSAEPGTWVATLSKY